MSSFREASSSSSVSTLRRHSSHRAGAGSLRLSKAKAAAPVDTPIPPSLLHSPHLLAQSIYQQPISPCTPSQEDEQWLQDTVPLLSLSSEPTKEDGNAKRNAGPLILPLPDQSVSRALRRSDSERVKPSSPPLVRAARASAGTKEVDGQAVHSDPGYFEQRQP